MSKSQLSRLALAAAEPEAAGGGESEKRAELLALLLLPAETMDFFSFFAAIEPAAGFVGAFLLDSATTVGVNPSSSSSEPSPLPPVSNSSKKLSEAPKEALLLGLEAAAAEAAANTLLLPVDALP